MSATTTGEQMKRVLIPILLVVLLLAGCSSNGAKVEELQSKITELEQQLAEKEAGQDKSEAIAEFAQKALELQRVFMNVKGGWFVWYHQNLPEFDNYPRYKTRSKEEETINQVEKLCGEVRSTITAIEQLYAPPEALETKKALLAEGDSLLHTLGDIINYYLAPDVRPPSLYQEAFDFLSHGLGETDKDVRRELTDLLLEYGQ